MKHPDRPAHPAWCAAPSKRGVVAAALSIAAWSLPLQALAHPGHGGEAMHSHDIEWLALAIGAAALWLAVRAIRRK